jgi:hypothetical protein
MVWFCFSLSLWVLNDFSSGVPDLRLQVWTNTIGHFRDQLSHPPKVELLHHCNCSSEITLSILIQGDRKFLPFQGQLADTQTWRGWLLLILWCTLMHYDSLSLDCVNLYTYSLCLSFIPMNISMECHCSLCCTSFLLSLISSFLIC